MDWAALRAVKEADSQQRAAAPLSEITPSIRDFSQFVTTHKQELGLIPALKRTDPATGQAWPDLDIVALAQACDDTEVGAIGVYTEPSLFGASGDDMRTISERVTTPLLALDLVLHDSQLHQARLCGADAVLLWAGALDASTLARLMTTARSIHVAPVVMARTSDELRQALATGSFIVGLASPSGKLDTAHVSALAAHVPRQKTVISLDELSTPEEADALLGQVDAAIVSHYVLDAADVEGSLSSLVQTGSR